MNGDYQMHNYYDENWNKIISQNKNLNNSKNKYRMKRPYSMISNSIQQDSTDSFSTKKYKYQSNQIDQSKAYANSNTNDNRKASPIFSMDYSKSKNNDLVMPKLDLHVNHPVEDLKM